MYSEVVMFFYPNFDVTPNIVKFGEKNMFEFVLFPMCDVIPHIL